jgi:uncharacterized protein involved in type VI secretion and phage assembly
MGIGAIGDAIGGLLGGGGGGSVVEGIAPLVQRKIKVEGTALSDELDAKIESVVVVDRLRMPDSFVITFRDPGLNVLDKAKLKIGAKIKIEAGAPGVETADALLDGEITSIEAEYDRLGTRAIVRGYDLMHRLSAGTNSRTFENVTYADVVKKVCSGAGLTASVDSTPGTLEHVIQPHVSDLHFIYHPAARTGFNVSVKDGKVQFKKPTKASTAPGSGEFDSTDPLQLVWGQRLLEFRARQRSLGRERDGARLGPKSAEAVIGKARAGTDSAQLTTSVSKLASTSTGDTFTVVDQPMPNQSLADGLAKSVAEQIGSAAYEATALVVGSPKLKSGVAVNISKVDPSLAGKWVITSARHEFGNGPYRTFLEFSGRQDRSILGLAAGAGSSDAPRSVFPGVVIGVVTDIEDKEKLGRAKVQYHWLGEKMVSNWARVARPSAGKDYGILWFPDVNEEVLVAFEHGDINYPIVIGSLWNSKSRAPAAILNSIKQGKVQIHGFASPAGHKILLYEDSDNDGIALRTKKDKVTIVLDEGKQTLDLTLDGKTLTITSKGDLKLTADGAITIESKKSVEIKSQGGVDIRRHGNATIKGAKVAVN